MIFISFSFRSEFYNIDNKPYDSYLYGKYVNNYSGDVIESFASLIRFIDVFEMIIFLVCNEHGAFVGMLQYHCFQQYIQCLRAS